MSGPDEAATSFTELVRRKIEERREGRAEMLNAAAAAEARLRKRAAPLKDALTALVARLSRDPMFANAIGRPEMVVRREIMFGERAVLTFQNSMIGFSFRLDADDSIMGHILLDRHLYDAVQGGSGGDYASDRPIRGTLDRLDELLAQVEDFTAELLADLYLGPAAHLVLGTGKQRDITDPWGP